MIRNLILFLGFSLVFGALACPREVPSPNDKKKKTEGPSNDCDNCPSDLNTLQGDVDFDTIGDVCDNCVAAANPDQSDVDADGELGGGKGSHISPVTDTSV